MDPQAVAVIELLDAIGRTRREHTVAADAVEVTRQLLHDAEEEARRLVTVADELERAVVNIARGTRYDGNTDTRVPTTAADELSFLRRHGLL